jgi:ParB family chromosome partitioning protein
MFHSKEDIETDDENIEEKKARQPKERGLGRGLDALFGDEEEVHPAYDEDAETSSLTRKTVGVEQVFPNPDQPRRHFDETALKELASSIAEHGLLQPILVRPDKTRDNMYEIIAGERRWRASQKAQLHEIPVIVKDLDDDVSYQLSLIENLQRQDLNAIEEALGYQRLVADFDHSHESIGDLLGKSRSHISNMIRLLALPKAVQTMVEVGDISSGHARALLGSDDAFELALQVIEEGLSVRETEKLVADSQGREIKKHKSAKKKAGFAEKDADTLALEKEVSDQIGMTVSIDMKDEKKGTMRIDFKDLDQLDDILQRLAHNPKK